MNSKREPFEQYEIETGKKWHVIPVCHGERAFCSNEYMVWLQNRYKERETFRDDVRIYVESSHKLVTLIMMRDFCKDDEIFKARFASFTNGLDKIRAHLDGEGK